MKILLAVAQEMGGSLPARRAQGLLFLYCTECVKRDEYYEFIPLEGAPYSLQAEEDRRVLTGKKIIEAGEDWVLQPTDKRYAVDLDFFEKIAVQELKNTWQQKIDEELTRHIAEHYPSYTYPPSPSGANEQVFYTIGYEGVSPEGYINALIKNGVHMLVDVRRNPLSKKYGFSKSELAAVLPRIGIEYRHIPELGIASEKRQALNTDSDYETLFKEYEATTLQHQQDKLDVLQRLLEEKRRIAITCFEADPWHCHRSRVARALKSRENFIYKIEHLQPCTHANPSHQQNARKYS